jgi:DNA modification methylase
MKPYYEEPGITIYHGDCREVLPCIGHVDLVLTDPPYGIGEARGKNKSRTKLAVARDYGTSNWDDMPPAEWVFGLLREISRYQIVFGGNYFTLPPSSCWLVWDKLNGNSDFADCELAWTNLPKAVRRLQWRWAGMLQQDMAHKEYRDHPTQKPLSVIKWALAQAPEDCGLILDPFMGSGTTLIAAKAFGRRAIGIEREQRYCDAAIARLRQDVLDLDESTHHRSDDWLRALGAQDAIKEELIEMDGNQ